MSGYSALVRSTLTIDGQCYDVASIGPDAINLRDTAVGHMHTITAGAVGELAIGLGRAVARCRVYLPDGATLGHDARYKQLGGVHVARGGEIEDASAGE